MDKLEPLIRHKFWIIFGLSLPLALFAYFSTSGKMAEATTSQETKLDGALNGVPSGASEPNETYAAGAKVINEDLQKKFDVQVQYLWEQQTERMTWPKIVVPFVPDNYRGEIESKARYTYMRVYPSVIERLWERVQPYVGDPKQTNSRSLTTDFKPEWPQKVIIDGHKIPHATFDMSAPAANKEIWDAQEDIWLLELIFDAIARINSDAQFVSDAPVRQIDRIELVAGSGESSVTSAPALSSGMSSEDAYDDYGGAMMEAMSGGATGKLGAPATVSFNVAEEFGAPVPDPEAESALAASSSMSSGDEFDDMGMMGMGMGMGGAGVKMQRYIGESGFDPFDGPYRERGFYMSVIILQDRIPDFLAELSSSPWPIRVGRFQIGKNPYAPKDNTTGGGGGYGMAFGGGGFGSGEYDDYGSGMDYDSEGMGGFGSMGGYGGMGGYGAGMAGTLKLPDYMKMPSSIPVELRSHPDLVQMDLCGIITMYNPVTDDSVEVIDDGSTEADFEEALETTAETPEEAQAMAAEAAAEAAAAPPVEADAGAAPADAAAGSETPAAPPVNSEGADGATPDADAEPPAPNTGAPADTDVPQ